MKEGWVSEKRHLENMYSICLQSSRPMCHSPCCRIQRPTTEFNVQSDRSGGKTERTVAAPQSVRITASRHRTGAGPTSRLLPKRSNVDTSRKARYRTTMNLYLRWILLVSTHILLSHKSFVSLACQISGTLAQKCFSSLPSFPMQTGAVTYSGGSLTVDL